jgi:hypothetical protein
MRSSDNDFLDLCTTLGLMTLSWAWAESVLAMTIGVINKSAGPIKGYQEAPLSLKKGHRRAATSPKGGPRLGGTLHRAFRASQ